MTLNIEQHETITAIKHVMYRNRYGHGVAIRDCIFYDHEPTHMTRRPELRLGGVSYFRIGDDLVFDFAKMVHTEPDRIAVKLAVAADIEEFTRHQERLLFVRPLIHGEFAYWRLGPEYTHAVVYQLAKGQHVRVAQIGDALPTVA